MWLKRLRLFQDLQGYSKERLAKDLGAGITVGVVALPLAMAFAIASGLSPQVGLWTAIVGGFLISLLGGSSVQIGGPAGAFIVVVYAIVQQHGLAGLLVCTASSGVLIFLLGWFGLGSFVRLVPESIVIGFTNGIAVLIALSQIKDLFASPYAALLGLATMVLIVCWNRYIRSSILARLPAPMLALVVCTVLAWQMHLPAETIGSRFGEISTSLVQFSNPFGAGVFDFSVQGLQKLVMPTATLTLLGAFESLLCARIADEIGVQNGKPAYPPHDPNQELMAQGIANTVLGFIGGMPATGTIARTLTNIKCGATSPVAGLVHAGTVAAFVLLAAKLAALVPLSVLAGLLLLVAWNMGEWHELVRFKQRSRFDQSVLWTTFVLTVVTNLLVALAVSLGLVLLHAWWLCAKRKA
jgi:SulP family sulfate permease